MAKATKKGAKRKASRVSDLAPKARRAGTVKGGSINFALGDGSVRPVSSRSKPTNYAMGDGSVRPV